MLRIFKKHEFPPPRPAEADRGALGRPGYARLIARAVQHSGTFGGPERNCMFEPTYSLEGHTEELNLDQVRVLARNLGELMPRDSLGATRRVVSSSRVPTEQSEAS